MEVTDELDTALTITEALYGEGVTDVRIDICEFAKQYVGNRYVWGGTSLTKGADCSGFTLAVYRNYGISLPHSSKGAGELRHEDQRQRGTAWRSDFLWQRQEHQPCGDVHRKRPGGACQQFPDRDYHFEHVLQKPGKRSARFIND